VGRVDSDNGRTWKSGSADLIEEGGAGIQGRDVRDGADLSKKTRPWIRRGRELNAQSERIEQRV
jgi:hypothetical protein